MIDIFYLVSIARRALLFGSLLIASCCALFAQPPEGPPGPPLDVPVTQNDMDHGRSVVREVTQLTQRLTLTDAQQSRVKALLTNQKRQIDELRRSMQSDLSKSDAKLEKMDQIRDLTDRRIAALLDGSQKVKFAAWQEQRKNAMERQRQRQENQPSSTTPPAL